MGDGEEPSVRQGGCRGGGGLGDKAGRGWKVSGDQATQCLWEEEAPERFYPRQ